LRAISGDRRPETTDLRAETTDLPVAPPRAARNPPQIPPENKQTTDPPGNSNADPQTTTIKGNQFKLKNNWKRRVIELTILSHIHFSEFKLGAWFK
jgi:hypothetical protein